MRPVLALAVTALVFAGCNATAEPPREKPAVVESQGSLTLREARQRWADAEPGDYRYVLQQQCFCPKTALRPVVVTVRDGAVVKLALEEGAGEVPAGIRENARTIEGWFDYVEDWQQRSPARLEVDWDRDRGYPSRILVDRHSRLADDEITWRLRDLTPLAGEGGQSNAERPEETAAPDENAGP